MMNSMIKENGVPCDRTAASADVGRRKSRKIIWRESDVSESVQGRRERV